VDILGQTFI